MKHIIVSQLLDGLPYCVNLTPLFQERRDGEEGWRGGTMVCRVASRATCHPELCSPAIYYRSLELF